MNDRPRYGRAKYATLRRDFDKLRKAIGQWDAEETEKAWGKCERWMEAIMPLPEPILAALSELPDGEWETWTSCSFRRISRVGGGDGDVLHAEVHHVDGHPDLSWTEEQCEAICTIVNWLRSQANE